MEVVYTFVKLTNYNSHTTFRLLSLFQLLYTLLHTPEEELIEKSKRCV